MTIADMKQMLGGVKALPKHLFKIPIIQYIKKIIYLVLLYLGFRQQWKVPFYGSYKCGFFLFWKVLVIFEIHLGGL